jgi:hypothetical protein
VTAQLRGAVGERHRQRAGEQRDRRRPRAAEPLLDRPLEGVAGGGGGEERQREDGGSASVEVGELAGDRLPLADQQRRRGAGVERDLEALSQLGVLAGALPAGEPGDQRQVGGARDRQQLGRPLNRPQGERLRRGDVPGGLQGVEASSATRPLRRRRSSR